MSDRKILSQMRNTVEETLETLKKHKRSELKDMLLDAKKLLDENLLDKERLKKLEDNGIFAFTF